ncbi:hypothetical protein PHYBLDRAFT_144162 [Phycomyces blakesleeanus NRRL 1555(-)]|uniref:Uncharacterized protein n=1 Tax=Phycomyces blakesleeanus (strain ATCC 8743b / DSM 1359 / FGSC 10004 / NBRC 33097 / NRRL 1555) TaxID=763407 RepID=A0A167N2H6_PHYB8|nr:hypothetical protein PHYBLDRAFT_144162 [Phycomyces blakesleeanus NRRL 1555(-)]OAD74804.1 hypothetical protein PHYBLDRAFT_144162 [Phycomyces blakesleeanus NRRL 1555(-)]|eukprot:XP_018292844.1 hypothetical protein PHYBLDRAFT_144162 [Phycomyces blakesleeanus NRRL 1555(-)]
MDPQTNITTWDEHLNEFQLAYNSSPHDSTKLSLFSAVFGREAHVLAQHDLGVKPVSLVGYHSSIKEMLSHAHSLIQLENLRSQAGNAITYNQHCTAPNFVIGNQVLIKFPILSNAAAGRSAKLSPSLHGPFLVVRSIGADRFDLLDPVSNKKHTNIHSEWLKKYSFRNEDISSS